MAPLIKLCGFTRAADLDAALALGLGLADLLLVASLPGLGDGLAALLDLLGTLLLQLGVLVRRSRS